MLAPEENKLLTRAGPGTPLGQLMRRYWLPALFSQQLAEADGPPVRVKLLNEELVAFRDTSGQVGLLEERCAHRGASLFFGRNEECGLRCVYHGWKYDLTGQCVDMPSEPAESDFRRKVALSAYPCQERGGVIWAYLGPPELQPGLPELEWAVVPPSHRVASRHLQESNWLQGLEGGFDMSHIPFLHRGDGYFSHHPNPQPRPPSALAPGRSELIPTAGGGGYLVATPRHFDPGITDWSVEVWLAPFHKLIRGFGDDAPSGSHMWVPIDDETCMVWTAEYHPDRPLREEEVAFSKSGLWIHAETLPGSDRTVLNKQNDYGIDRPRQRSGESFTGIRGLAMQDSGIQESMGPIYDRTREHLGESDLAIIGLRRRLQELIKTVRAGDAPPGLDPACYRLRSAWFTAADGVSVEQVIHEHVQARSAAYANPLGETLGPRASV